MKIETFPEEQVNLNEVRQFSLLSKSVTLSRGKTTTTKMS